MAFLIYLYAQDFSTIKLNRGDVSVMRPLMNCCRSECRLIGWMSSTADFISDKSFSIPDLNYCLSGSKLMPSATKVTSVVTAYLLSGLSISERINSADSWLMRTWASTTR